MKLLLVAAGVLDLAAAALHLACIAGGAPWYRFLGAGSRLVRMAEAGWWTPHIWAAGIAAVLAVWAAYCFSAAGLIPRLPLMRTALVAISAVYLLRAAAAPLMLAVSSERSPAFIWWSSAIVLGLGLIHAAATALAWTSLSQR